MNISTIVSLGKTTQKPMDIPPDYFADGDHKGIFEEPTAPANISVDWWLLFNMMSVLILAIGTIINFLYAVAFLSNPSLRKKRNIFKAALGIVDFVITFGTTWLLVAKLVSLQYWPLDCKETELIVKILTNNYHLFYMIIAVNYYCGQLPMTSFTCIRFSTLSLMIFVQGFSLMSGFGVYYGIDYTSCDRKYIGNRFISLTALAILYIYPTILTLNYLFISYRKNATRTHAMKKHLFQFQNPRKLKNNLAKTKLHVRCYGLFVACWIPHLVVHYTWLSYSVSDPVFYALILLGVIRSNITSCMNIVGNLEIRKGALAIIQCRIIKKKPNFSNLRPWVSFGQIQARQRANDMLYPNEDYREEGIALGTIDDIAMGRFFRTVRCHNENEMK